MIKLIFILLLVSCKTTQSSYVGITLAKSKVNSFPKFLAAGSANYTLEIKDEYISGTSTTTRSFGFKIKGSSEPLIVSKILASASKGFSNLISSESIINDPDIAVAASKALDMVNADTIYITDIKEEISGIPILSETRKYTVRGKPMFLKSLGSTTISIDQKLLSDKNNELELLDEELSLLKLQYEKIYGTKVTFRAMK